MRKSLALLLVAGLLLAGCAQKDKTAETSLQPEPSPEPAVNRTVPEPFSLVPPPPSGPPQIGHVFLIVLENEDFATTFPAKDPPSPYLAQNLTRMGRFLPNYYGIGHASLDNYIAMVSGQAPNPVTQGDCFAYVDFHMVTMMEDGQAVGQGCVYPPEVKTIGDQMTAAGLSWRQYAEDMAATPDEAPTTCRHQPVNSQDTWQGSTSEKDQYATRHVPFVYFHSIIDDQASCDAHVVDLELLKDDLKSAATTPNLVFITPDVCSDGHDAECANPDQRGEYDGIDDFLHAWIPLIRDAPAYQKDGLIVVTFDEAEAGSPDACCGEPAGYNTPMPGISGPGGGQTGAVLISGCLPSGTVDETPYNHYSLLRSLEEVFHVPHLGYAGLDGLVPFGLLTCAPVPQ
jgi:hypothetical protein